MTTEERVVTNSWREEEFLQKTLEGFGRWQWDLVCSRSQLVNVSQMLVMVGVLVGNIAFSIAADRFGRKRPLVLSGMLQMLTGCCASISPWLSTFLMLRFLQGVATGGLMTTSFVLGMEVLDGKWRTRVTALSLVPFNLGHETMVPIAYFTRHWRLFQLAISVPSALVITFIWLVPESPRWLLAVGRQEEAVEILKVAAATNKIPLPAEIPLTKTEKIEQDEKKSNILDLLRTPNMRKKTLAMSFNWMAGGLCFYGLTQYVSTVNDNIFINVAIGGMLVIPGMIGTVFAVDKFGRRATLLCGNLLSCISCLLIVVLSEGPGKSSQSQIILASFGILGMGISFSTVYLYSGELFPTVVRNVGVGFCSMCVRIGSMIAPFAASLDAYINCLSPITFGLILLVATTFVLLLPETKDCQLPQTLEEGDNFGRKEKPFSKPESVGVGNESYHNEL